MDPEETDLPAAAAGHDRTNPSGISDEGMEHEHQGQVHQLRKEAQPVPDEHHEEGHTPA